MKIKIMIIGGVAGGATAAARARRLNEYADIILFERGEYVSFANCGLPYYIGGYIERRNQLFVATPEVLKQRYAIDVRTNSEVLSINRTKKELKVKNLKSGKIYTEIYDKIILSPGAEPMVPLIKGVDIAYIFTLRNILDTDRIMQYIQTKKPEKAIIVGGGFVGLEMAENLTRKNIKTTIIEMFDQVMPPFDIEMASMIHDHLQKKQVNLELATSVTQFLEDNSQIVVYTSKGQTIKTDMVIWAAGVKPENKLAVEANLETGLRDCIKVNTALETSDTDIFAVGDAIVKKGLITGEDTFIPLAGLANKEGRIAADNIMGKKTQSKGILGTSIVKIFDINPAITGLNEKTLKKNNISYLKSYTFSPSHATYYPGSETMCIKLLYSSKNGKVFGAQIIGGKGVDKRIDIIATAIKAGMTVNDIAYLELSYSPPFSSAIDPVNIAGHVASNILNGDMEVIHWDEIESIKNKHIIFLDLRTKKEIEEGGSIENSLNIPIDKLRKRLKDLDKDKLYILFCAIGLRGYIGYRILVQNGFKAKNLSGGLEIYKYAFL